jgi:hypothetical protein
MILVRLPIISILFIAVEDSIWDYGKGKMAGVSFSREAPWNNWTIIDDSRSKYN